MTPREIDALVAEKIFNQPVVWLDIKGHKGFHREPFLCESNEGYGETYEVDSYTEYITDAWKIVEEMNDCLHLRQHGNRGRWAAKFCGKCDLESHADTATMAICLAALKAVGVEILA